MTFGLCYLFPIAPGMGYTYNRSDAFQKHTVVWRFHNFFPGGSTSLCSTFQLFLAVPVYSSPYVFHSKDCLMTIVIFFRRICPVNFYFPF